ncbi:MAG: ferredoxin [Firmicutes bacterium HGW-Firmicutes-7]|nr:MAG: ferredoxin [Firmicutes bacterium HGW-Firmicutes-7]
MDKVCCNDSGITDLSSRNECECGLECCIDTGDGQINNKNITIDFLFLDLSVCERCQDTDTSLDEALKEVEQVLTSTGASVIINKINVNTEALALHHKFISSPTIRINGRDIQLEVKENSCKDCGDLCGDEVDCRVWSYEGSEYAVPPKAMIIEALLKAVYGNESKKEEVDEEYIMPENLKLFYTAMSKKK